MPRESTEWKWHFFSLSGIEKRLLEKRANRRHRGVKTGDEVEMQATPHSVVHRPAHQGSVSTLVSPVAEWGLFPGLCQYGPRSSVNVSQSFVKRAKPPSLPSSSDTHVWGSVVSCSWNIKILQGLLDNQSDFRQNLRFQKPGVWEYRCSVLLMDTSQNYSQSCASWFGRSGNLCQTGALLRQRNCRSPKGASWSHSTSSPSATRNLGAMGVENQLNTKRFLHGKKRRRLNRQMWARRDASRAQNRASFPGI